MFCWLIKFCEIRGYFRVYDCSFEIYFAGYIDNNLPNMGFLGIS